MKVIEIYKKEYKCSKCGSGVQYGKVTDESGKIITKDGNSPNGKFGKESNVLSAAVNVGTDSLHLCYADLVKRDFDQYATTPQVESKWETTKTDVIGKFVDEANEAYLRLSVLAAKLNGGNATAKENHITTMALMHDYFSYLQSR